MHTPVKYFLYVTCLLLLFPLPMTFGKIVNITITTVPAKMIYDITHFKVNPGDTVNLTLKNIVTTQVVFWRDEGGVTP